MPRAATSTGTFRDRFPYIRIGSGAAPLVVLPGLSLTNQAPGRLAVAAYARGFRRLAEEHTLYVVQRPHGLVPGSTTQDIAREYATVVSEELGPVRLMGLSTGGLVAQHLALDHPSLVDCLALVVTGARLVPSGQAICRYWLELAAAQRWRRLHGELGAVAVDGPVAQWLARAVLTSTGKPPSAEEAKDFGTTVAAVLAHDTRERLAALRPPTLVVGGATDPFFPEEMLRETAAPIPDVRLRVFPRRGHGVPKHEARALQDTVATFFASAATFR
jgi:pimeloyl-ACP methyl ester carboxylesterase